MRKLAILAAVSALGLAVAACDSEAENQVEQTAEAIDEVAEGQADLTEAVEAGGPNEEAAEQQADAMRKEGEETKDHLENEADQMDNGTPQ